ncbi:MAG: dockerin type I repeat-containing protein, partial [Clostridia bacterium]|nr:dockerin type I repeat-containing protein [Clostridia bacterium]
TEVRKSDYDRDKDGYRDNYYGFLRGAADVKCIGVLIEHSYHTNERATLWLLDDENLKALAVVEAEAIADFCGVEIPFLAGDVDGDGEITQFDYILAKRIYFGTYEPTEDELKRADVDGDGTVSVFDYIAIRRKYFGTLE